MGANPRDSDLIDLDGAQASVGGSNEHPGLSVIADEEMA